MTPAPPQHGDPATIIARLRSEGRRITPARRKILEILANEVEPLSSETIIAAVGEHAPDIHAATTYRNLTMLHSCGIIAPLRMSDGAIRWQFAGQDALWLECARCGRLLRTSHADLGELARALRLRHGFLLTPGHHTTLGVCAACNHRNAGASRLN